MYKLSMSYYIYGLYIYLFCFSLALEKEKTFILYELAKTAKLTSYVESQLRRYVRLHDHSVLSCYSPRH